MYWYSLKNTLIYLLTGSMLLVSIASCKKDSRAAVDTMKFFDIKGFFRADSIRLTKLNPLINKTVFHDNVSETKQLRVSNWGNELNLFTTSDINKPAWKTSYSIENNNSLLIYRAKDPSLKTQEIAIKKDGDKVKWILIFNHTKNILYETVEKLSYFPDSLYLIQKSQRVKILGKDTYRISGAFINGVK